MNSERKATTVAGILFIVGTLAGVLGAIAMGPVLRGPDILSNVFTCGVRTTTGAFMLLIMAFACAGIAIWLYPILKKYDQALALGAVGFRIMENLLAVGTAITLFLLLPLSREYVKAGAPSSSYFQTLANSLLAGHDTFANVSLISFCLGALMYYTILFRSKLIPRWLSGWGLIAIIMNLASAILVLFSLISSFSPIQLVLSFPILVQEMVFAVWLIAKGFKTSPASFGDA